MDVSQHLKSIQPSYIREILRATQSPDVISLAGGLPASEMIPVVQLATAMKTLTNKPEVFQYGETHGYPPFLEFLAEHHTVPSNHSVLICNGSQQAIDLIARAFLDPGDGVAMEAPSYLGALQVFGLAQADIKSINQCADGPDLNELESVFVTGKVKLFYAVPDFHNPTGVCWSLDARKAVAQLCMRYDVALIEDVPYRDLRFSGQAQPLVSSFCPDHAFVLRSFSKISAPGVRLGMVSAPDDWLSSMVKIKQASDLHTALPMQAVLLEVLSSPAFQTHLECLRSDYKNRYQVLAQLLQPLSAINCYCEQIEGGMFVWLRLPESDPMAIARAMLENGVAVVPGDVFYADPQTAKPALRLNFTNSSLQQLELAVTRLRSVLTRLI